jgi:antitoxin CptB
MIGTTSAKPAPAGDGQEPRRKKLRFRSWHRGMREMDFVLGRFADAEMEALTDDELDQYERLLDIPDTEFFSLVTGETPVPGQLDCPLLQRILASGRSQSF